MIRLVIATVIGAVAWLYQRAWERQQRRIASYQAIVDQLPGFTSEQLDHDRIDAALLQMRRLWLFASERCPIFPIKRPPIRKAIVKVTRTGVGAMISTLKAKLSLD